MAGKATCVIRKQQCDHAFSVYRYTHKGCCIVKFQNCLTDNDKTAIPILKKFTTK